jgi:hypothetical protein
MMKAIAGIAALCVCICLALMSSAQASTIAGYMTATSETIGVPTTIYLTWSTDFTDGDDDPTNNDDDFTVESVEFNFGDGNGGTIYPPFKTLMPETVPPTYEFSYMYSTTGGFSISAILYGFFSSKGVRTSDGYTNGNADVMITGFSDTTAPIPAALPLFMSAIGILGVMGWRHARARRLA